MVIKYKAGDLINDFSLNAKEGLAKLSEILGTDIKKSTVLSEDQADLAFEYYSRLGMIDNIADYIVPTPPAEKKPSRPKREKKPRQPKSVAKEPGQGQKKEKAAEKTPKPRESRPEKGGKAARRAPKRTPKTSPRRNEPLKRADGTVVQTVRTKKKPKTDAPVQRTEKVAITVDTRRSSASVNLDKFNEKYDQLAQTRSYGSGQRRNQSGGKQKIGKGRQPRRNPYARKRKETEAEKLERMHLEKARKAQLKVRIPDEITVGELASRLKVTASEVIKKLMSLGVMASISEVVDFDTASLVAEELGAKVEKEVIVTLEERLFNEPEDESSDTVPRAPVVVVMGHVDHGKTSLLDAIRNTNVTRGEAGGITQHIGAYQVTAGGKTITFLDTPGHEAFTAMRQRGAMITDIAILVVAADDGIMPQTIESINHAKAAGIPIIVAINKIDKPTANPERVKQGLTEQGLVPEEWGGDTICVNVSALTGEGIPELLEMINLTSEVAELRANPNRRAKGAVIEARLDRGLGPVATVLVQNGTLHRGDVLIAGTAVGRVRIMTNDKGQRIESAGPSTPVEITGLTEVPAAGDLFDAVEDEKLARELAARRSRDIKEERFSSYQRVTLDTLFENIEEGERKELAIVVKADVQGSAEAVRQSLEKLSNDEVKVRVIHSAVGAVSRSDVMLAAASNAIIIGFNVRPDATAKAEAEQNGVEIRLYRVIYDAINDVRDALRGMLAPKYRDVDLGSAEVREVYRISSVGTVAGCYVKEGKVARHAKIRVVRDGIVVAEDEIASLRRFKDDVREVSEGYECGIALERFSDFKEGDIFESFVTEEYTEE